MRGSAGLDGLAPALRGGAMSVGMLGALLVGALACSADETGMSSSPVTCTPGQAQQCACLGGTFGTQMCLPSGAGFASCVCGPGALAGTGSGAGGGAGFAAAGAGAAGLAGGAGFTAAGTGAGGGSGQASAGTGGSRAGTGGGGGMGGAAGAAGAAGTAGGSGEFDDALRQACVDHINMYRATLSLPPLRRGTPQQETCSDEGAKKDGDSGQAHGSAGDCQGLGGQNTCPGWRVGGFGGNATLEDALKNCLDSMWGEGEPPVPVDQCIADRQGCFQMHGHWINMSNDGYGVVACGFYKMANGAYWMNQNFGR